MWRVVIIAYSTLPWRLRLELSGTKAPPLTPRTGRDLGTWDWALWDGRDGRWISPAVGRMFVLKHVICITTTTSAHILVRPHCRARAYIHLEGDWATDLPRWPTASWNTRFMCKKLYNLLPTNKYFDTSGINKVATSTKEIRCYEMQL